MIPYSNTFKLYNLFVQKFDSNHHFLDCTSITVHLVTASTTSNCKYMYSSKYGFFLFRLQLPLSEMASISPWTRATRRVTHTVRRTRMVSSRCTTPVCWLVNRRSAIILCAFCLKRPRQLPTSSTRPPTTWRTRRSLSSFRTRRLTPNFLSSLSNYSIPISLIDYSYMSTRSIHFQIWFNCKILNRLYCRLSNCCCIDNLFTYF